MADTICEWALLSLNASIANTIVCIQSNKNTFKQVTYFTTKINSKSKYQRTVNIHTVHRDIILTGGGWSHFCWNSSFALAKNSLTEKREKKKYKYLSKLRIVKSRILYDMRYVVHGWQPLFIIIRKPVKIHPIQTNNNLKPPR